ncbi:MAG TPA: hypothetical protein VKE98_10960 [Gemmataceae bacterium]|nr:hypothetical protein [Gemmataceae bacterium]
MTQKDETFNPFDPTGMFKDMQTTGMDAWSKMMIQMVHTDAYAKATGIMLDTWASSSAVFRQTMETIMREVLTKLNMPTRADVIGLAERLGNIEMRLDDLEAKLDEKPRGPRKAAAASPRS